MQMRGWLLLDTAWVGWPFLMAMENFPETISVAIFVTAQMPGPTHNISTLNQEVLSTFFFFLL